MAPYSVQLFFYSISVLIALADMQRTLLSFLRANANTTKLFMFGLYGNRDILGITPLDDRIPHEFPAFDGACVYFNRAFNSLEKTYYIPGVGIEIGGVKKIDFIDASITKDGSLCCLLKEPIDVGIRHFNVKLSNVSCKISMNIQTKYAPRSLVVSTVKSLKSEFEEKYGNGPAIIKFNGFATSFRPIPANDGKIVLDPSECVITGFKPDDYEHSVLYNGQYGRLSADLKGKFMDRTMPNFVIPSKNWKLVSRVNPGVLVPMKKTSFRNAAVYVEENEE